MVTNKDLLYSAGNFAQCYVTAWMGGEFVEQILICEWLHHSAVNLSQQLLISYPSIQNKN